MKFSESWLREWVNPKISREELCAKLTMAGLEIEELAPVSKDFSHVVVAQVISVKKHPEADRLNICEVDVGTNNTLTIVCGAENVKAGMKVPAALEGAELPGKIKISAAKVRGIASQGMLCSARELSLSEESEGLFELPQDAPLGKDLRDYLKLNDYLIDVSITPNRGDCLSVRGMAKDVSALTHAPLNEIKIPEIKAANTDTIPVIINAKEDCPRYAGRIIRAVKADAPTPIWLREHLRRSGIRSISAIVDVTNYVMLELGQPMHAFSLDQIAGGIDVRKAKAGEKLKLLDGSEVELDAETTVIADQEKPLAIAGVMGGLPSGVTLATKDIFLESAFFNPASVARTSRHYNLGSDSSYRFERGIDPDFQRMAVERATQLILEIAGGQPGPVIEVICQEFLPTAATIDLRKARVTKVLGCEIPDTEIEKIFSYLEFSCKKNSAGWQVTAPGRRSDISIEEDLIEEIARLYGYDKIPCNNPQGSLHINSSAENKISPQTLRHALSDLGYHEVVTYSFVDKKLQTLLEPQQTPKELMNPITADMNVMRTNLWPGLINTLMYNQNRQQSRIRIFETGLKFLQKEGELQQERVIAGLISGSAFPEQWGIKARQVDFFDLKGDLQNLFKLTHASDEFSFETGSHPALHPGQTAAVYRNKQKVGILGALHPSVAHSLKLEGKVFVFELSLSDLETTKPLSASEISKFPEIRRDLALLINQSVPARALQDTIREVAGNLLKQVDIFDVYQGKGIESGFKSVALSLTLQHSSRTLVDEEVADIIDRVIVALKGRFNAELRG
jgi:phenylalanyl-tRNA synthetase beta chain